MEADKSPDHLAHVASALERFRGLLVQFLRQHVETADLGMPGHGLLPAVVPREGADRNEIQPLFAEVSRAAGKATDATRLTNGWYRVQDAGAIDPTANWETITRPKPLLEASDVLGRVSGCWGSSRPRSPKQQRRLHPLSAPPPCIH